MRLKVYSSCLVIFNRMNTIQNQYLLQIVREPLAFKFIHCLIAMVTVYDIGTHAVHNFRVATRLLTPHTTVLHKKTE